MRRAYYLKRGDQENEVKGVIAASISEPPISLGVKNSQWIKKYPLGSLQKGPLHTKPLNKNEQKSA
jgi:hypothetical protein